MPKESVVTIVLASNTQLPGTLIKLLEKRNRTIDECSRYEAASLDQITGRLASIKSRQEAEMSKVTGGMGLPPGMMG